VRQKSGPEKQPAEEAIKDIRRATRRHFSAEEKIRVVLEGLRGEESIAELCRREGIASSMYYGWSILERPQTAARRQHSARRDFGLALEDHAAAADSAWNRPLSV
jgi:transposase-like protein